MKLRSKLVILYVIGGALPLLLSGFILLRTNQRAFVRQVKEHDGVAIYTAEMQTGEMLDRVHTASRYFIFDPALEKIALHAYTSYPELVKDYGDYQNFTEYGRLYAGLVSQISFYVDNPTIRSNANFVHADEAIREQAWFRQATGAGSPTHWLLVPRLPRGEIELAYTRQISARDGRPVGVLVMHLRPGRMKEILDANIEPTFLLLNDEVLLARPEREELSFETLQEAIGGAPGWERFRAESRSQNGVYQGNLEIGGEEYLVTGKQIGSESFGDRQRMDLIMLHPYREILASSRAQSRSYYLILGASALLSLTLIFLFSMSFSRRIRRFRTEIERSAEGDYSFSQPIGGRDEISELYNHLARIMQRIHTMNEQIQEERLRSERLRTAQREAELKTLTMQINPHFLYNTLETIRMRALIEDQPEIELTVQRLAKLLRYTLEVGDRDVALREELAAIEAYLEIQEDRLGPRLRYEVAVEPGLGPVLIMPLLIQPLVENAMIHALEDKATDGHLAIRAREEDSDLYIEVEDNGPGLPPEAVDLLRRRIDQAEDNSGHIGLRNVHQRIRLRYGEAYGLRIESREGEGTCMILVLPVVKPKPPAEGMSGDGPTPETSPGAPSTRETSPGTPPAYKRPHDRPHDRANDRPRDLPQERSELP